MNIYNASQPMPPLVSNVSESLKRQRDIDELIHTLRYGPMPDFLTNPKSWYFETEQRIIAILKKHKVHASEAYRMAHGHVQQAEKDSCFNFYAIVDKAIMEYEQRQRDLQDEKDKKAMAVKQNPKPPKQAEPGAFANADIQAKANDAAEKAVNHNREVMGLRLAWQVIEANKKYPKIDPGNLREKVRAEYECTNDDDLVDHKSYDRPILEAAFASAIDEWQANQNLAASVSPDEPIVTMANATDPRTYAKMDRATVANDLPKSDKASDWFPRCPSCNDALVDGKCTNPACPALFAKPPHWSKTTALGKFWRDVNGWFNKYPQGRAMDKIARRSFVHTVLSVDHLEKTPLSQEAAVTHVRNDIDKEFATKPAEEIKPQNAPISNEKASNLNDAPKSEVKTNEAKIDANLTANSNGVEKAITITPVPMTSPIPMPDMSRWDIMRQQATVMIKSGFLPQSIKTPEQALTIMMMGDALGIQPIVALNNINVIQQKPTVSPQLQLALIRRSGLLEAFKVTDDGETCTVIIKRKGEAEHTETFSQKDAAAMGLSGKDNWRKQPATMRRWRAISAACRLLFSDIVWGIAAYTSEEIDPDYVIEAA